MNVWIVYRNSAGRSEGRGSMILDKIFVHKDHAVDYIENVCGEKPNFYRDRAYYNFYSIEEKEVLIKAFDAKAAKRQQALEKLTAEEKQLLGLE